MFNRYIDIFIVFDFYSFVSFCGENIFFRNISKQSSEILVEVWDRGQKVGSGADLFLGLGIGEIYFLNILRMN